MPTDFIIIRWSCKCSSLEDCLGRSALHCLSCSRTTRLPRVIRVRYTTPPLWLRQASLRRVRCRFRTSKGCWQHKRRAFCRRVASQIRSTTWTARMWRLAG